MTAGKNENIYDVIIVGAGAAGLMCAASPAWKAEESQEHLCTGAGRLVLEATGRAGVKLLMSGGGHCNITHEGKMRDLLGAYEEAGKKLRAPLYRHGNQELMAFLEEAGVPLFADETGRVLPQSMKAQDVLDVFLQAAVDDGFEIRYGQRVEGIAEVDADVADHAGRLYEVRTAANTYRTHALVIAAGGCSYPSTGSNGQMFDVLHRDLGIEITELSPGLVPILPEEYPYEELAGITLPHVRISIHKEGAKSVHREGALLFTHRAFSGPCALDLSSHAAGGSRIALNYIYPTTFDDAYAAIRAQGLRTGKAVAAAFAIPRRLAALLTARAADSPKRLAHLLTEDTFTVAGTEGFRTAMVTKGGVPLRLIDPSAMVLKDHPGLYVIGEVLDADGISGGYNLQLCWSTAQTAAHAAAHAAVEAAHIAVEAAAAAQDAPQPE